MSEIYYKAVRPDGTDFHTGTVNYLAGGLIQHPNPHRRHAGGYLSVSVVKTDCAGFAWPARLLRVEPVGGTWTPDAIPLPNKRACYALRVVEELPAQELLGPQWREITELARRAARLTLDEATSLGLAEDAARRAAHVTRNEEPLRDTAIDIAGDAARGAARSAAAGAAESATRSAVRSVTQYAAWSAAWSAARRVAWDAAHALVARDLIGRHGFTQEHYDTLTKPWRTGVGPIHPDDADVKS